MAIAVVQEPAGAVGRGVTAVTLAFAGNVTNGNLVAVGVSRYANGANTALIAGDCTQSAGTATSGTVALDKQSNVASTNPAQAGVWSVPVTGTGTFTARVAGPASSFFLIGIGEYSGTDVSASRVTGTPSANTAVAATSPATTGNTTSAGDALFFAALSSDFSGTALGATAGNSFTNIATALNGSTDQTGAIARRNVTGAATTGGSWTLTTTGLAGWAACVAAYKVAGGGGGGRTFFVRSGLDGLGGSGPKQFNPTL